MKKLNNMTISLLFIMFTTNCLGMKALPPQKDSPKARDSTENDMIIEKNIKIENYIKPITSASITSKKQIYTDNIAVKKLKDLFNYIYLEKFEDFKELLKRNPELALMVDSKGNNILIIAAYYGRQRFIEFLLENYDMNLYAINKEGENALLMATSGRYTNIVELLIEKDSSIMQDIHIWSPAFIKACENKNWDIAKYLLTNFKFKDGVNSREVKYSFKRLFSIIEDLNDCNERNNIENILKSKQESIEKIN